MSNSIRWLVCALGLCLFVSIGALIASAPMARAEVAAPADRSPYAPSALITLTRFAYLPLVQRSPASSAGCQSIPSETYTTLSINPPPSDRRADQHADLNLGLRGYVATGGLLGLVNINGSADGSAPQFPTLFGDLRTPLFTTNYQVYNWSWTCDCRTTLVTNPSVTLAGLLTLPGETVAVPNSGYDIGSGYQALVLYASPMRITLKYTREDNVIQGYTVHIENVCVEPRLLALYQQWNSAGRGQLPALRGSQPVGRAIGTEVAVAVQDAGVWMDPRSRKD
ncbi:MAG: hypothetical protein LC737_04580, partial [Chloroflexi bacterium]|nr:hypothetical protein [Chloroflexota bacterium]